MTAHLQNIIDVFNLLILCRAPRGVVTQQMFSVILHET